MSKKHVLVIGAGPAGISFADKLVELSDKFCITILEKSQYIGGISKTVNFEGNRIDIGGHRFFSKSDEVMNWWAEKFPVSIEDDIQDIELKYQGNTKAIPDGFRIASKKEQEDSNVLLLRNRKSRIIHEKKLYDYPLKMNKKTLANIGALRLIKVSLSYIKSKIASSEPNNLEEFIVSRFGKTLYKMFFESYTEKVWGRHPSEISAEWGAQRIKGLSIRKILQDIATKTFDKFKKLDEVDISQKNVETSLIEKFLYPKYGPGQIWEFVAKELEQRDCVTIHMNSRLTGIEVGTQSNKTKVKYVCSDGDLKELTCDFVVSTMPISHLVECLSISEKDKGLSKSTLDAAKKLPYRDFLTVGILLRDLHGPNGEELDDTWLYVQEPNVKVGRIQIFNNWSPYMVKDKRNKWIGLEYFCQKDDELWSMSNSELVDLALKELYELGLCSQSDFLKGTVLKEEKTYPAYFDSYAEIENIKRELIQIKPLFLIGRNGMHKYNNQDHSMLTAFRTAEIIASSNIETELKESVWDVNTEQEYHETK